MVEYLSNLENQGDILRKGGDESSREGIHILSLNSSHLTIVDITRYTKSKVPFLEKRSRSFVDHDWQ